MVKAREKIVLVDDNITNLTLAKNILAEKYIFFTIPSGAKLFALLEKIKPDLILLDIEMPEMSGYEVLKILKADRKTAEIPVIFLTAKGDAFSELEGLNLGAVDYISKPFSPPLLIKRIELHLLIEAQKGALANYSNNLENMVQEKVKTIVELQNLILKTMANLAEHRDGITGGGGHIERTKDYLEILLDAAIEQNIYYEEAKSWDRDFFLQSSQLHDLGKISIRDSILLKQDKLTEDEFNEMKNHTLFGVKIIEEIAKETPENSFLIYAKTFAGTHHEKWNGTGYPYGLKEHKIPLPGRLMAIADVYDALISTRSYKKSFTHEEAVKIIVEGKGSQFDPDLVDLFLGVADKFAQMVAAYGKNGKI
jgi:putative two-component system response regulator